MEPIRVRCRSCNKEVEGVSGKSICCGCSNLTTVYDDRISARDMSKVIMLCNYGNHKSKSLFSGDELDWQEKRNRRRVRKLDFEVR
tara:strand:- start:338 stop:595 length:258 start_codon:yes stop_codon:yes gene_type:complete